jgi:hypothetical protein
MMMNEKKKRCVYDGRLINKSYEIGTPSDHLEMKSGSA